MADEDAIQDLIRRHDLIKGKRPVATKERKSRKKTRDGITGSDLARMLGKNHSTMGVTLRRHQLTQYEDRSWNTDEVERYVADILNISDFRVPQELRGRLHQDEPSPKRSVQVPELHANGYEPNGQMGHVTYDMAQTERMLIYYRAQSEMLKSKRQALELDEYEGRLVDRDAWRFTLQTIVSALRSGVEGLGKQVASSLVGLEDEREIRSRIDEAARVLLTRMQGDMQAVLEEFQEIQNHGV